MRQYNLPDDNGFSLIQNHGDRALQLEKMRAKLASQSLGLRMPSKPKQRFVPAVLSKPISLGDASSWAPKLLLALSLAVGNGAYLYTRAEGKARHTVRSLPKLAAPPAKLDANRQALYWTYALYDYDKLTTVFGVPKGSMVDFAGAHDALLALLPKVDEPTRLEIERYLPKAKGTP